MRKIIVEVDGAPKVGKRAQAKRYKVLKANKASPQRAFKLKSQEVMTVREQRSLALSKVFGIFRGRQDAPQDGLAFQLAMRAE